MQDKNSRTTGYYGSFLVRNMFSGKIPPYAIARVDGAVEVTPDSESVIQVNQPDGGEGGHVIIGPNGVPNGGDRFASRGYGAFAQYDSDDGEPAVGESWGPTAESWKLKKGESGFDIIGDFREVTIYEGTEDEETINIVRVAPQSGGGSTRTIVVLIDEPITGITEDEGKKLRASDVELTEEEETNEIEVVLEHEGGEVDFLNLYCYERRTVEFKYFRIAGEDDPGWQADKIKMILATTSEVDEEEGTKTVTYATIEAFYDDGASFTLGEYGREDYPTPPLGPLCEAMPAGLSITSMRPSRYSTRFCVCCSFIR